LEGVVLGKLYLAHLVEGHENLCHGATSVVRPLSVRRQLFPWNDFFSRTTRPISTKLGMKHTLGMGIQICSGPFWGPISGKIGKVLINLQNSSSHEPLSAVHWYLAWSILGARGFNFYI